MSSFHETLVLKHMPLVLLMGVAMVQMIKASINHDPRGYTYHEHTLTRPYDDGHDLAHWEFLGSTVVSDKYIRLTPDHQSRKGGLWNKMSFEPPPPGPNTGLSAHPPWEAIIEFRVHGSGKKLFGDGFAFWYTKDRANQGPVFGNQNNVGLQFFDLFLLTRSLWVWEFSSTHTRTFSKAISSIFPS